MPEPRNGFIYVCFFFSALLPLKMPPTCIVLHCLPLKTAADFHVDINLSASLKDLTVFYGRLSVHGGRLRYEGICQIQNRYDFLKGENLSYNVDINLSASLKHLVFYGGLSVHGGCLRYEGICQMPEPRNGFIYV